MGMECCRCSKWRSTLMQTVHHQRLVADGLVHGQSRNRGRCARRRLSHGAIREKVIFRACVLLTTGLICIQFFARSFEVLLVGELLGDLSLAAMLLSRRHTFRQKHVRWLFATFSPAM